MMKLAFYTTVYGFLSFFFHSAMAETTQEAIRTFEQHTQSSWMNQINQQSEAITQNPDSSTSQVPNLIWKKPQIIITARNWKAITKMKISMAYSPLVNNGRNSWKTSNPPEGEAWRLLNQSPDRYYPDANEHKILHPVEESINALQHPNTWSKQKHWPTDDQGNPIYDKNSEMSATIARCGNTSKAVIIRKSW